MVEYCGEHNDIALILAIAVPPDLTAQEVRDASVVRASAVRAAKPLQGHVGPRLTVSSPGQPKPLTVVRRFMQDRGLQIRGDQRRWGLGLDDRAALNLEPQLPSEESKPVAQCYQWMNKVMANSAGLKQEGSRARTSQPQDSPDKQWLRHPAVLR